MGRRTKAGRRLTTTFPAPPPPTTELLWTGSRGEGVFQFDQRASIETKTADGVVSDGRGGGRVRGKWVGRRLPRGARAGAARATAPGATQTACAA